MIEPGKNSLKSITALLLFGCLQLLTSPICANYSVSPFFYNSLTTFQDSSKADAKKNDTIPGKKDSLITKTDTFQLKMSKDSLDAPIAYEAADSMVLDVPHKKIILYSKGKVTYTDMVLTADSIQLDQNSKLITATYRKDSAGNIIGRPLMKQGGTDMEADIIRYNYETQKGLTYNTITQQGEMHVQGETAKKVGVNTYFILRGQITTCNLDTPHFAFRTKKLKLINQKLAVTGPIHPEFEGVPVPIYLPFGFFPLSQGRHSGLLPPQFTASQQFGLGLEGLGYYKVLNDYFDVTLRTNIYSYGGWNLYLTPSYRKRYRYNGSLNLALQHTSILTNDPKQEFQKAQTFNITWGHTVDSRARPGTTFSANVNAGSTKYNQYVSNNPIRNFTNQLNSSISYSKTWNGQYNLNVTANHNQNNNTRLVNLSLPNVGFTVNTFYPFQKKDFVGNPKWYQKLGLGLNSNVANQISFYDSAFSFRRIIDTIQWGAQHSVPIQLSLPPMGPLQISPGINYQEKWYSRRLIRQWNDPKQKVDTVISKGFFSSRDVSFSLGLSTAIFGMFDRFGKNSRIRALRHVIRPNLSINYKPDLAAKDYYSTQIDTGGRQYRFSYFDGSIFGPFSEGTFGGIGFGIDNNIEAKVRSKKDTSEGPKKIRLIDGFGFNGGYNFMADSFKLSTMSFYARSTLFEKINITAGATLDPYQVDTAGFRKNKYAWKGDKFSLGRIVSGNIAISATFQSKPKDADKQKQKDQELSNLNLPPMTMEEQMSQLQYVRSNASEFVDFNIPWSLNLSYSLNFSRQFRSDYRGFKTETFSSLNWNGDFSLTEKWKLGMNGYYDFNTGTIPTLSTFITREMHCWQLSINVSYGLYKSFNLTINPKSGLLRDLRINRTRYFYGG